MKIQEETIGLPAGSYVQRTIVEATFDEWIVYLFDRPERSYGETWSLREDDTTWGLPLEVTAEYVARTYEEPQRWTGAYSATQISAGLSFTWDSGHGDVFLAMQGRGISARLQTRIIRALFPLYERCFANQASAI